MGNEAFTEAQEKQIVEVIRATVAEVLRQQEAKKQCGDTESQARVAAHIERQRKQLEQIRAEQAAEHDDPIPRDVPPHGRRTGTEDKRHRAARHRYSPTRSANLTSISSQTTFDTARTVCSCSSLSAK